jgi:hypothetical protein
MPGRTTVIWLLAALLGPQLVDTNPMIESNQVLLPLALYNGNPLVIDGVEQQLVLGDGVKLQDAIAKFCA